MVLIIDPLVFKIFDNEAALMRSLFNLLEHYLYSLPLSVLIPRFVAVVVGSKFIRKLGRYTNYNGFSCRELRFIIYVRNRDSELRAHHELRAPFQAYDERGPGINVSLNAAYPAF